jgi:hypothetical protein
LDFISGNRPRTHGVENRLLGPHLIAVIVGGPVSQTANEDGVTVDNGVCIWFDRTFEHHSRVYVYYDVVSRKLAQHRLDQEWLPYPETYPPRILKVFRMCFE